MSGSGPWYRAVGWSYLRYSNVCADLLRNVLKEPHKSKAASRQIIAYKFVPYNDGKAGKQSECMRRATKDASPQPRWASVRARMHARGGDRHL